MEHCVETWLSSTHGRRTFPLFSSQISPSKNALNQQYQCSSYIGSDDNDKNNTDVDMKSIYNYKQSNNSLSTDIHRQQWKVNSASFIDNKKMHSNLRKIKSRKRRLKEVHTNDKGQAISSEDYSLMCGVPPSKKKKKSFGVTRI
ncbi:hypothetical protein RFI_18683 [Reticulomyxa filosa]|uniref:Uncharacterized protein n=1 Tax=Reticulomyxa filosa TaxID=46433 RepID=X6MXM9_RETFI|nr:hypothetical protein RFI_18683 [Reticulomyxa filosa]|eukprot:ETO18584.1 hypothetical protein RFI_18683 [Reticulomyxa filosa]